MSKDLVEQIEKQIVHTESLFAVDKDFKDERFMRVRVAVMHSGINRNQSRFSIETIKNAKSTFANIPILAEVKKFTDSDGNEYLDYTTHAMHIENDAFNDGEQRIIYDEQIVGIVPETNNFEIVHDDDTGNDYVYVDALIYREYGNYACDILEAKGGITDVSAEILCDDCSFSASDKCLDVGKMTMSGITLLGEDVTPGMAKAHAQMFSITDDSKQNQLIKIMQELTNALDNYTTAILADNITKGGTEKEMNKFEELMVLYNKTIEDITFEYEGLADDELEAAFKNAFSESEETVEDKDDSVIDEETPDVNEEPQAFSDEDSDKDTDSESVDTITDKVSEEIATDDTKDDSAIETEDNSDEDANKAEFSIGSKTYSVSLSDIMYALSELVNETYADENSYYSVEVYMDEHYVIMMDWITGKAYKQSYKVKKDSYSLTGDRVPVKAIYVTEDEEKELDKMRNNYSVISEKLAKYEADPEKVELLKSKEYSSIHDKEEFIELSKFETRFDLSIDEIKSKADDIILVYAKNGTLNFASTQTKDIDKVHGLPTNKRKTSRYGNLFSGK